MAKLCRRKGRSKEWEGKAISLIKDVPCDVHGCVLWTCLKIDIRAARTGMRAFFPATIDAWNIPLALCVFSKGRLESDRVISCCIRRERSFYLVFLCSYIIIHCRNSLTCGSLAEIEKQFSSPLKRVVENGPKPLLLKSKGILFSRGAAHSSATILAN